mgnify:CR=1 FL=1
MYLDALETVHKNMKPKNYLEIGCRFGDSLSLAKCDSIGIDPNMRLKYDKPDNMTLFDITSDDYFEKQKTKKIFGSRFHLAYVDGMHLAEYALRDFINLEKESKKSSVVLFDDILPRRTEYAGRKPASAAWCGDVYKVLRVLKQYRPDLTINVFDVAVKGLGVVTGLDRKSTVLEDNYEKIEIGILADHFTVSDVKVLRDEFSVRPVDELAKFAKSLRA